MGLITLDIQNIRNLEHIRLKLSPRFNIFYGPNASGKTSLLEAIYILGHGASFRTNRLRDVARRGIDEFSVYGKISSDDSITPLGVKYADGEPSYTFAGAALKSRAKLAEYFPLLIINPESHRLLSEGPSLRRQFIDWGVFHVERSFFPAWCRYQQALKQRNAALRIPSMRESITAWDQELCQMAAIIDGHRRAYHHELEPYLANYIRALLLLDEVTFEYNPGWRDDTTYSEVLLETLPQDIAYGYTRNGPHRADMVIKIGGISARAVVSRGQQKLLICAMMIAQAALLKELTGKKCTFLIDDLAAELDVVHRQRLLELLGGVAGQVFITGTEKQAFLINLLPDVKVFHVEQGKVTEMTAENSG